MLEFDATEVRSTCDKKCKFHITFYSKERVFLHSNNCVRRWTNEGQKRMVTTESVSPTSRPHVRSRQPPKGFVTLDLFNGVCNKCKGAAEVGYKYCWPCEHWLMTGRPNGRKFSHK